MKGKLEEMNLYVFICINVNLSNDTCFQLP